jgi:hypothetical protein
MHLSPLVYTDQFRAAVTTVSRRQGRGAEPYLLSKHTETQQNTN